MNRLSDWLSQHAIQPPDAALPDMNGLRGSGYAWAAKLFGRVALEPTSELASGGLGQLSLGPISTRPPVLGPNVAVIMVGDKVRTSALAGASSFERALATLVNGSILMEPEIKAPTTSIHLYNSVARWA
jgi:hypothetical protein